MNGDLTEREKEKGGQENLRRHIRFVSSNIRELENREVGRLEN